MPRRLGAAPAAMAVLVTGVLVTVGPVALSSASYSSSSNNTAAVRAAADWTPPTVALQPPGAAVSGTVTLTADATDGETGVASVAMQQRPSGSTTWSSICTTATTSATTTTTTTNSTGAQFTCAWDTIELADGPVDLRAVAVDGTGLTTTSATVTTAVANLVTITLAPLGGPGGPGGSGDVDTVRGTVPLAATLLNAPAGWSVQFEYAVADSSSWKTICTRGSAPYTCSWVTTGLADQEYDVRAVAVSGSTTRVSEVATDVLVDNTAPTVTMVDPGSPLRGTVTFATDADDAGSGIDSVAIQYAAAGTSTYRELCTVTDEPFSCSYRTHQLADGAYSLRAVATDRAGNTTTSTTVGSRVVDNTVASVAVDDPGAFLRGRVDLSVAASSSAGVSSVRLQRTPAGTGAWTDLCTDTTAPYGCTWDTATVGDGLYDLRALMVDAAGRATTSAILSGRRVDNSPLRGADVQTANGGGSSGRLDSGDTVTFTYSRQVDPATVISGWNGATVPVTVRVRDGYLVGGTSKSDVLDVQRNGAPVPLGSLALRENHVPLVRPVTFAATLTASTTTVGGVQATTLTVTLGARTSGTTRVVPRPATIVWTPSAAVADLTGRGSSTAPVTETGPADREF